MMPRLREPGPLRRRRISAALHALRLALGFSVVGGLSLTQAAEPPALFLKACAPCHGKDGKAATPQGRKLGVKDMTLSTLDETQIRQQIREGKKGPDGALRMPAFQETLKAEEIERLAKYAFSLQVRAATNRPAASAR